MATTSTTTRTIIHYSLRALDKHGVIVDANIINNTMKYIYGLNKNARKLDDDSIKKVHFLAYLSEDNGIFYGYFKSAKYDYRPPLIDKTTLSERKSPKLQTEGESELTHFAMSVDGEDILLFLEQKRTGVTISTFARYLKKFISNINNSCYVDYGLCVRGDFNSKLKELSSATAIEVYVPNKVVTDTFGDEAVAMKNVKHDAVITISAERSCSIKQSAKDIFRLMTNHVADINRIKIYGKVGESARTLLDTSKLKDKSTLSVNVDNNNQVVSSDILSKIKEAIFIAL